MSSEPPVLIAGAGPTGLTLACDLARRGITCRIVDKAPGLFPGSRGKGVQPRTLEVFDDLGVIDAVLEAGAPFPDFRMYLGTDVHWTRTVHQMLGVPRPDPGSGVPYPDVWLLPQWRTDEILRDRLAELGGRVEFDTELVDFEQDPDGVTATLARDGIIERVRARYLVGADGGRSTVRKRLGVGFEGETFETERTLIGDVRATGLTGAYCHILTTGDVTERFSLWSLPGTDYYQFVATVAADRTPDVSLESMQALLDKRSGRTDIVLSDLRWASLYRVNARMVDRFRVGRVLLAGDAAHTHSSASGQGLNTSVQDAYNLGWKLAATLGGADDELLDTYDAERHPVAAEVLGVSTRLHHRNFRDAAPDERTQAPDIFQLRLDYRDGPLAVDDRTAPGSVRAGDRAPDAHCGGTRLHDLLRGPHFTLLAFGTDIPADLAHADPSWLRTFRIDTTPTESGPLGEAHRNFDLPPQAPGPLILIRPDGYIGAVSTTPTTIHTYLRRTTPAGGQ
ncbi:2-polyprenyl-6-methoxyphenol hydroxylase-like FAD-dependent oxidoreductase [Nocardia transvalensis]|uniref:2-polyprenyl-6-methoxyphenol hydroxylase-like FAD-dependent oxidoreductase n=1 Tax=Nocardia transvalensis TaxID=37333 RepID=A0A7W9PDY6_9NOCA|nr:FAD-dependent monooxygenase [Nocardia transvalensis]MBB5914155.1 2-polyprenyl-6-methoxyphenol hydroxylase-like FAD-dependent oxidoreductase [Nocardia transvalensis]